MAQATKYPQFEGDDQVTIVDGNHCFPRFKDLLELVPAGFHRLWQYGRMAPIGGIYTVKAIMRHPQTKEVVYFIADDTKAFLIRQDGLKKIERKKRK